MCKCAYVYVLLLLMCALTLNIIIFFIFFKERKNWRTVPAIRSQIYFSKLSKTIGCHQFNQFLPSELIGPGLGSLLLSGQTAFVPFKLMRPDPGSVLSLMDLAFQDNPSD